MMYPAWVNACMRRCGGKKSTHTSSLTTCVYDSRCAGSSAMKRLGNRIEQLLELIELQVRQQELRFEVAHHLRRDGSPIVKRLYDQIDGQCHPAALAFDVALEAEQLLQSRLLFTGERLLW